MAMSPETKTSAQAQPAKRTWAPQSRTESRWALLLLSPWLVGFMLFTLGPMIASLIFSFSRFQLGKEFTWVGLENYARMFSDGRLINALAVTFIYALVAVPSGLILGFFLAYLLNLKVPGGNLWRTLYYMPAVITPVITGTLFLGLFDPRYGLVNYLISRLGGKGPEWFLDPQYAIVAVIIISLWGVGSGMVIYLSGLQSIPTSLYEAADLDGCNRSQRLFRITIPMMTPIIFYNLVVGIIGTFQLFTQVWVLTKGGPHHATEVFNIYMYKVAFENQQMGYASSMAWVLFLIILVITSLVFRSAKSWVHYENEVK